MGSAADGMGKGGGRWCVCGGSFFLKTQVNRRTFLRTGVCVFVK